MAKRRDTTNPIPRKCSIEGCNNAPKGIQYCHMHRERFRRNGTFDVIPRVRGTCSISGCEGKHVARGFCNKHYLRYAAHGDATHPITPTGAATAWLAQHQNYADEACLVWPFGRKSDGYGQASGISAHRAMCILAHGNPPTPKHEAAHSCGKGHLGCVNPKHLRWATKKENNMDRFKHGTAGKLTESQVLAIRSDTRTGRAIAAAYGISPATVCLIRKRKTWSHVCDDTSERSKAA